ncbi:type VII secretion protein EccE [Yinghuangia sp. ASG 101]|uniref:type VII secretion protein EccE n=1 Tax=Yinghuangia sp. ASG 101 TaxID=2896848 RepID=UPI001E3913BB|nr:type VII secretion protein EccE [Yinghuangia sp. ASG 101]UGQ09904.1 type VII secretion protein EccE [Yinghuangia sp. ASG 101]
MAVSAPPRPRRGGTPAPGAAAAGPAAGTSATPRVQPRPGRMGAVLVQHLVVAEIAVLLVVLPLATRRALVVPGAIAAAVLVTAVVARFRGRRLALWPGIILGFRRRRRAAAAASHAGGSGPTDGVEADLAPIRECVPGLRVGVLTDRSHRAVGFAGDGTFLTAVLLVEAPDDPLRSDRARRPLPLSAIADALRVDDVVVASAQIVQHTRPAPAPHLPTEAIAARSYRELRDREGIDAPAIRQTWIALRLDADRCEPAVAARGGGVEGAQRALLRALNQLAASLGARGLACGPLDEQALVQALFTASGGSPAARRTAGSGPRTAETRHAWRCDDRWHTTYWIARWPRLSAASTPDLVGALTGTAGPATTFSLTAQTGGGGSVALTGHVRVSARSADELDEAAALLEARARQLRVGLVRLDWEQRPALMATLPLGGHA